MTIQGSAWSTSDFASGAGYNTPILSNQNLTCQLTSANNNATIPVSVDGQAAGKFYVEFTPVAGVAHTLVVGVIQNSRSRLLGSGGISNYSQCAFVDQSGNIGINNAVVGTAGGAMANGTAVGMAFDLTGKLIWFRLSPGGNYNNSGLASPATGVGGFSTAGLSGLIKLVAYECSFSSPPVTVTLNAGSSAFSGTVPTGFTAGWPTDRLLNGMMFNTLF